MAPVTIDGSNNVIGTAYINQMTDEDITDIFIHA